MRFQRYLMAPMVCVLALAVGCGKSDKRAAARDTAGAAGTRASGTTEVAMREFYHRALVAVRQAVQSGEIEEGADQQFV